MKVMGANGLMVQLDSRAAVSTTKEPLALQPAAGFYHEKMPRGTERDSPGRRRPIRTPRNYERVLEGGIIGPAFV